MESNAIRVSLAKNPKIAIRIHTGHFSTSNAHSNHYLDYCELKCNASVARDVAKELAIPYLSSTVIDTIVCIEKTSVIAAYLAEELLQDGTSSINSDGLIHVVSPITSSYGNWVFPSNRAEWINGKNILLLVATISSGRTLNSMLECISYYGGNLVGISTLYLASPDMCQLMVNPLFTSKDIPGYQLYAPGDCQMCKDGQKIDALISSEGYTRIE